MGEKTMKMEQLLGLLRVKVGRGINLAVRDVFSSDPYVTIRMGKQKLKTSVKRRTVNPEWNEDLTLCVIDPSLPIKLVVFDKDTIGSDDPMGHAEFDIRDFVEVVEMHVEGAPNNTIVRKITPCRSNCLAEESKIYICDGNVVQDLVLRLKDVESGELELQLQWMDLPSSSRRP